MKSKTLLKYFSCLLFLLLMVNSQTITPSMLLPVETTKGIATEYSIGFETDTDVPHSAKIIVKFPFEFDPLDLIDNTGCKVKIGGN